jgi:hypothetical protein
VRKTTFKLRGVSTWVNNIKNTLSEEAARAIVTDLKEIGPYWTGQFEEAWRVKLGTSGFAATEEPILSDEERRQMTGPFPRKVTETPIPKAKGRQSIDYSIGNITTYRDIALDLVPGRYEEGKRNTTDQDWYITYIEGGSLRRTLEEVTLRTSKNPKIKGFRGLGDARERNYL